MKDTGKRGELSLFVPHPPEDKKERKEEKRSTFQQERAPVLLSSSHAICGRGGPFCSQIPNLQRSIPHPGENTKKKRKRSHSPRKVKKRTRKKKTEPCDFCAKRKTDDF